MASVAEHYETHLAPVYSWTVGGIDRALSLGTRDLADIIASDGLAVDLGAGFGMHAIPLARAGYRVLAIDTSAYLLDELRSNSVGMKVEIQQCNVAWLRWLQPLDSALLVRAAPLLPPRYASSSTGNQTTYANSYEFSGRR